MKKYLPVLMLIALIAPFGPTPLATAAGGFGPKWKLEAESLLFTAKQAPCKSEVKVYNKKGTGQYAVRYFKNGSDYRWSGHTTTFYHSADGPANSVVPGTTARWNAGKDKQVKMVFMLQERNRGKKTKWHWCHEEVLIAR